MTNEIAGLPTAWFTPFVEIANRIPQGSIARDYQLAVPFLQSLQRHDLTWIQAQKIALSETQIVEFTNKANDAHAKNNINHRVHATSATREWNLTRDYLLELGIELSFWYQMEKNPDQEPSKEISLIDQIKEKTPFTRKLEMAVDLAIAGVESFELPESKAAISFHMFLTKTDASYRRQLCAQPALIELYKNVERSVKEKALLIQQQTGEQIPAAVTNWFSQRP